jgi:hypothetical protein
LVKVGALRMVDSFLSALKASPRLAMPRAVWSRAEDLEEAVYYSTSG